MEITIENRFKICEIQNKFEINSQVITKSVGDWLQTNIADNWTLIKQKREGEKISALMMEQINYDYDQYYEQNS